MGKSGVAGGADLWWGRAGESFLGVRWGHGWCMRLWEGIREKGVGVLDGAIVK